MSHGPPNPGFRQEKVHKGDFQKNKIEGTPILKLAMVKRL